MLCDLLISIYCIVLHNEKILLSEVTFSERLFNSELRLFETFLVHGWRSLIDERSCCHLTVYAFQKPCYTNRYTTWKVDDATFRCVSITLMNWVAIV